MEAFISLFSQYNVPAAFLVNIELTLWSALFSTILGVILVMMRISPVSSLRAVAGATETSSLMSEMIEYRSDVIVPIFLIFAFGYVILIIPIGMLTTYLSNKLAVRR